MSGIPDSSCSGLGEQSAIILAKKLSQAVLAEYGTKEVLKLFIIWSSVFIGVLTIFLLLGFGRAGVSGGSAAALYQRKAYGGFTPAGSLFSRLTSAGTLGLIPFLAMKVGVLLATVITLIYWLLGVWSRIAVPAIEMA